MSEVVFTKNQLLLKRKYALMRMRFYLKELGYPASAWKKSDVVLLFSKLKYSEHVSEGADKWIMRKILLGDFDKMKTGRKTKAKKLADKQARAAKRANYTEFLMSDYWESVRKMVIKRDGNKCTECGGNKILQVHHLNYGNHLNEHEHLEDLITVCKECHQKIHKAVFPKFRKCKNQKK